ncbi:MAG: S8 family serine peptidase [bacterium]|nr:S8 family serine peptidase [bacterium]
MRGKGVRVWGLVILFIFMVVPIAGSAKREQVIENGKPAGVPDNFVAWDIAQLKATAESKGGVRIIVRFEVPGVDELTAISSSYVTGNDDVSYVQAAVNADIMLAEAISRVGFSILHKLNGVPYNVNREYSTLPCLALTVGLKTLERLEKMPEIVSITEDVLLPLPREPEVSDSPGTSVSPPLQDSIGIVKADKAWDAGFTGSGWYVAVLDTGISKSHEMFQGKDVVEACFALGDLWYDLENGGCPNGEITMVGPDSAEHYANEYFGIVSDHGSAVAGVVLGNNGSDRFGVAKDADLIALQVFSYFDDYADVLSWRSDQLKALEYLYTLRNTYKIAAANMSLGGFVMYSDYCNDADLYTAIRNLYDAGIATVVASGNDGFCYGITSPACIEEAVSVNAINKDGTEFDSGNWSDTILDLMAPGVNIEAPHAGSDTPYHSVNGTSFAAPHVAGAWAILKQLDETADIEQIRANLRESGTPVTTKCGTGATQPLIDLEAVLKLPKPPLNLSVKQEVNRSFLQTEFINVLTWDTNPRNAVEYVTQYRVYVLVNERLDFVGETDISNHQFWHRRVAQGVGGIYAVTTKNTDGQESVPVYFTMDASGK